MIQLPPLNEDINHGTPVSIIELADSFDTSSYAYQTNNSEDRREE